MTLTSQPVEHKETDDGYSNAGCILNVRNQTKLKDQPFFSLGCFSFVSRCQSESQLTLAATTGGVKRKTQM